MNKLRVEIRRQIKKILLEQYSSGGIVIGGNPGDFFGGSNYAYSYDFEQEEANTRTPGRVPTPNSDYQKDYPDVSDPRLTPEPPPGNASYEDKQVSPNHIQFKEGYEVYRVNEKEIQIKNLKTSKVHNYQIKYAGPPPLTIIELKMINSSASLTARKAGLEKTVVLSDLNKQTIMTNFENNTPKFDVTGTTTDNLTGTVKFIKVS